MDNIKFVNSKELARRLRIMADSFDQGIFIAPHVIDDAKQTMIKLLREAADRLEELPDGE